MKKLLAITLWLIAIALWMQNHQTLTNQLNIPAPYQSLYEEVLAPVVKIRANGATGSGVIISDTYILTAAHVVGDENEVQVIYYSYRSPSGVLVPRPPTGSREDAEFAEIIRATVVITDTNKDLALLRYTSKRKLPCAKLADRNYKPYLFTEVYAVGCSLGLNPRPSSGHICAICGSYWEISAPILPGNSGGGVFLKDTRELIGITVWVRVYHEQLITTMAGIVPINQVYNFLEECGAVIPLGAGLRCRSVYEFLKTTPLMNCEEHKSGDLTSWSGRGSDGAIGIRGPGRPTLLMKGGEKSWHN